MIMIITNYQHLKTELKRIWSFQEIMKIPIVKGALGTESKKHFACVEKLALMLCFQ